MPGQKLEYTIIIIESSTASRRIVGHRGALGHCSIATHHKALQVFQVIAGSARHFSALRGITMRRAARKGRCGVLRYIAGEP